MLRTLYRLLPTTATRKLTALVAWLSAAAILQGIALGLGGVSTAMLLGRDPNATLWLIALAISVLAFVLVQWHAQMVAFADGTTQELHLRLGEHLARLPLGWFTATRQAQIIDLATQGMPQFMSYTALLLRPAITAVLTPIAAALTLAILDWRFTIAILAAALVLWLASKLSDRLTATADAQRFQTGAQATRRLLEYANLQPIIRTSAASGDTRQRTDTLDQALLDVRSASIRSIGTLIPGLLAFSLILNALLAGLVALGVAWISGASLSVPVFLAIIVVVVRLTAIASAGAELATSLQMQRGILERAAAILDAKPLPVIETSSTPATRDEQNLVESAHVSFSYGPDARVLDDASFTLPRHGLTALVGPSGSGKTTLARLLARFWDPTAGAISLDGRDLRACTQEELATQLATVLQDDYLLDATLADNIRLGRPDASDERIRQAISATGLDTLVDELPEGIDTPVGPGGARLSGGQRQRVCVARALLKQAPLTLMDEATSALDPENARLVRQAATRLARTGSVLLIAHNLDTLKDADHILVLDNGRIVQHGTYDELNNQDGPFRHLHANNQH
jgi:ATP-binding cassette subfamily B protein